LGKRGISDTGYRKDDRELTADGEISVCRAFL
jgi:hypothetical protein